MRSDERERERERERRRTSKREGWRKMDERIRERLCVCFQCNEGLHVEASGASLPQRSIRVYLQAS